MHAGVKLGIGIVVVIVGLWLLIPSSWIASVKPAAISGVSINWGAEFLTVLKGIVPPALVIIGALIAWIEWEELKSPSFEELEEEVEEPKAESESEGKSKEKSKEEPESEAEKE